jgi:hypothetical protein
MMVAARVAIDPDATASASSGLAAGKSCPVMPCCGRTADASESLRLASVPLIRRLARRKSAVFRYPSSGDGLEPEETFGQAAWLWKVSARPSDEASAAPSASCHPVSQEPLPAFGLDPQPAGPADGAAAGACFRALSTAPAATICRKSVLRESSSTRPAKLAASSKRNIPASATAVALRAVIQSRAAASGSGVPV